MKPKIPIINSYSKYKSLLDSKEDFDKRQTKYKNYLTNQDLTIKDPWVVSFWSNLSKAPQSIDITNEEAKEKLSDFCLKYADLRMSPQSLWETASGIGYLSNLINLENSYYDKKQVEAMYEELSNIVTLPESLEMTRIVEIDISIPDKTLTNK